MAKTDRSPQSQVFLSYKRAYRSKVEIVSRYLESKNIRTWFDTQEMRPGDNWSQVLEREVKQSDIMLVFLTSDIELSEPIMFEVRIGDNASKPMIGIQLEDFVPKEDPLNRVLKWQLLPAFGKPFEEYLEEIHQAVRRQLLSLTLPELPTSPVADLSFQINEMWIKGFLNPTIAGVPLKEDHRDGLSRPLTFRSKSGAIDRSSSEFLSHFWHKALHQLFISGEEGSGKTVKMLQLVSEILPLPSDPDSNLIPMIFDIGTWVDPSKPVNQQLSLIDWIALRLRKDYHLSASRVKHLLDTSSILYCLDGFDALIRENPHRNDMHDGATSTTYYEELFKVLCAELLTLRDRHDQFICTGSSEVEALFIRNGLTLPTIAIESWTETELLEYLSERGLDSLAKFLREHPAVLLRVCKSFAELQMMATLFTNESIVKGLDEVARTEGVEAVFSRLYTVALQNKYNSSHQIARNSDSKESTAPKVSLQDLNQYAPAVASYLSEPGQGYLFSLDAIQPLELPKELQQKYLANLTFVMAVGVLISAGLPSTLAVFTNWITQGKGAFAAFCHAGLCAFGFCFVGLMVGASFKYSKYLVSGLLVGFAFALGRGLDSGTSVSSNGFDPGWPAFFGQGGITACASVPICIAMFWAIRDNCLLIEPIEMWETDKRKTWYWILASIGVVIFFWVTPLGWYRGLTFGTITAALFWSRFGKKPRQASIRIRPNQAILYSFQNSIWHGAFIGILAAVVTTISYGFAVNWAEGILDGFMALSASVAFFFFGGIPVAKHWALRRTLQKNGSSGSRKRKKLASCEELVVGMPSPVKPQTITMQSYYHQNSNRSAGAIEEKT